MALDATVGGVSANSYATVAEVATYIATHYPAKTVADKWTVSSEAQKEAALIRAAQLLDRHVSWQGEVATEDQALSWPRVDAYDRHGRAIASNAVPGFLKDFQIETALWVMEQSGVIPQVGSGEYDSITVGPIEINYNEQSAAKRALLPESVVAALYPMGLFSAQTSGGVKNAKLIRV